LTNSIRHRISRQQTATSRQATLEAVDDHRLGGFLSRLFC